MGPLLFNIFINDLAITNSLFEIVMYADDTTLVSNLETFGNMNNVTIIENNINGEIIKITKWLQHNKLLLNVNKSKFMFF